MVFVVFREFKWKSPNQQNLQEKLMIAKMACFKCGHSHLLVQTQFSKGTHNQPNELGCGTPSWHSPTLILVLISRLGSRTQSCQGAFLAPRYSQKGTLCRPYFSQHPLPFPNHALQLVGLLGEFLFLGNALCSVCFTPLQWLCCVSKTSLCSSNGPFWIKKKKAWIWTRILMSRISGIQRVPLHHTAVCSGV